ncbi:carbamoyl-phosphate synthase (glutamine-hydrolyzing) [Tepidanaerobacter syntrophicus]|uniref:carbamoyl-phosphate synthase large subunit n=1 Tax=Tepidanaerobacter syntrophicus TaxID=224999 RepID=UPI0022EE4E9D|nr:carbamoyl-phosphate synthase large subunit [Tepidanaerobacter syntrophicus]GLI51476.1 carbamoyl-phosphate synthase (glutamine-hydrolyzing) [Tepidanaerobacter syntrophicus]
MPKDKSIKKVMVIGSGPIIIGQAAEFDYAGTQACLSLKEEGLEVVLINSNPATIMTDSHIADRVYVEPITPEFAAKVLRMEKPDGLLATLGGQVGLNMAVELAEKGILDREGVRLLGTPLGSIKKAEDRELFKNLMEEIGEPVPDSRIVHSVEEAMAFAKEAGLPLIVRPAYTLGGTGGGIARTEEELLEITHHGLRLSRIHQVLLEKSLLGMKEIEFEVIRDRKDQCICICDMENIDPVGVHTGDSIVVAPTQTLTRDEYKMLKDASFKIIRALGIEGGCNIQFALDSASGNYYVIEVNPRVSRSSALASKAAGYPIAKITTKIATGLCLDEIKNPVNGCGSAYYEPVVDYVVVKVPRWPFDKFSYADRSLGTQMKATGEVMAIDTNMEGALMKAIRSLEQGIMGLSLKNLKYADIEALKDKIQNPTDERLYAVAEGLRRGLSVEEIQDLSKIDKFFLEKIKNIISMEEKLAKEELSPRLLKEAKAMQFPDKLISEITGKTEEEIESLRDKNSVLPSYRAVKTCPFEDTKALPYFYSSFESPDRDYTQEKPPVIIIGSGPIRIGQGIEFDYCSVHAVWAAKEAGCRTVIINNNPETVSTDFNTADRLYFEPLHIEDVLSIIDREKPPGVIVQFGGQTAINLAAPLENHGVKIFGTSVKSIDLAEDREKFDALLNELGIPRPKAVTARSVEEALAKAGEIGFPLLVRPSYVLGGRAMEIVDNMDELKSYMENAVEASSEKPVLLDRYIAGTETEVDAVCDGKEVLIPGIMEHIERAGIHSGDSIAVYPHRTLSPKAVEKIVDYTTRIALRLSVKGLINIQFVVEDDDVYIIEVNPRSSRTVPYMSKITNVPMVNIATKIALGATLADFGYKGGLMPPRPDFVAVKAPVFSFSKLRMVEPSLGPEMKSTGEVLGMEKTFEKALYKAFIASGITVPTDGAILATIADRDKEEAVELIKKFWQLGFKIYATSGTAKALEAAGVPVEVVNKVEEGSPNIIDLIRENKIDMIINTLTRGKAPQRDGFKIRRAAAEDGIPCLTSLDTAWALYEVIESTSVHCVPLT